jgi:excisionase family DNA binding protein
LNLGCTPAGLFFMTANSLSGGLCDPCPDRLLTLPDVVAYLQLSVRTIRRLIASERLAVVRLGRAIRVRPRDLEAFVASSGQRRSVDDKDSG